MEDNIIEGNGHTIIINGGNPLKDCPANWEEAKKWEDEANKHLPLDDYENWRNEISQLRNRGITWTFDCGFKLDFDGSLLQVSSRFYPPKTHYGSTWDGTVHISMGETPISQKTFDCETLEQLKKEVEDYISQISEKVKNAIKNIEF